ncbi:TPA: zinc-ribbon domain-containing protein [Candidatus Bathyarchaeota archaeon]|nr:zinc-ribbon domain-containing protein [Candidatus Bathyarchaeota archaeon]HIJ07854.1 zinc-ribbon domain-containing protein [Candidatus Bathyarchaeota archaeon]
MPFCPKCGKEVTEEMNICPYCGESLKTIPVHGELPSSAVTIGTKNSGLAAVLSLIIPGLGQMYAGQIGRGLLFLFIGIPLTAIIAVFFFWLIFPMFLPLAFWIWNIYDAYKICNDYNRVLLQTGKPPW